MEVEATPDKKKPPLWGVQQNRVTTPIISHHVQTPRSNRASNRASRAKPYPSPGKVGNSTPSQQARIKEYNRQYQADLRYCKKHRLNFEKFRMDHGRKKVPKSEEARKDERRQYQADLRYCKIHGLNVTTYRKGKKQPKVASFGSTLAPFPSVVANPPVPPSTPPPPAASAPWASTPPPAAPSPLVVVNPPVPPPTPPPAAPSPLVVVNPPVPPSTPPPAPAASAPWASTPPPTSRKALFACMTPEQRSDMVACKKRKAAGYTTLMDILQTNSNTMNTAGKTMSKDSVTVEKLHADLNSNEDELEDLICSQAEADMKEGANAKESGHANPSVVNPSVSNPSVSNNPPTDAEIEAAHSKCCIELNECSAFFEDLKAKAEAGVCVPCIEVVTKLMSDIDSVHIVGTEEQMKLLLCQKQDHLIAPLKELCEKFNIVIDWDYYDL